MNLFALESMQSDKYSQILRWMLPVTTFSLIDIRGFWRFFIHCKNVSVTCSLKESNNIQKHQYNWAHMSSATCIYIYISSDVRLKLKWSSTQGIYRMQMTYAFHLENHSRNIVETLDVLYHCLVSLRPCCCHLRRALQRHSHQQLHLERNSSHEPCMGSRTKMRTLPICPSSPL